MKTTNVIVTCLEDFDVIEVRLPNGGHFLIKTFDENQNKIHVTHVASKNEVATILPTTFNGFDVVVQKLEY